MIAILNRGGNMAIKDIVGKFRDGEDDYIELDMTEEEKANRKLLIEVERLENYNDSDRLQKKVREGSVLVVKIRDLRSRDLEELKRAVEKLKKTCLAIGGDIAGLGEDWLILAPSSARVHREDAS
jgi:SepF-like predicted cell division protein (DUF552 family)